MIDLTTIKALQENDGLTLKNGVSIQYKTGWQVSTEGVECKTPEEAFKAIKAYKGTCGVWLSKGIYYIDKSKRIKTKREAMAIGKAYNQISILKWSDMSLVYC